MSSHTQPDRQRTTEPPRGGGKPEPPRESAASPPHYESAGASTKPTAPESRNDAAIVGDTFSANVQQIAHTLENHLQVQIEREARRLDSSHFQAIDLAELEDISQAWIYDRGEIEELACTLEETRCAVVTGEAGVGKKVIALLAAKLLLKRRADDLATEIQPIERVPSRVLLAENLCGAVRITLPELLAPSLQGSILIFPDAFRSDDNGLIELARSCIETPGASSAYKLGQKGTVLLLTSDLDQLPNSFIGSPAHGAVKEVKGPGAEARLGGFRRAAKRVVEDAGFEEYVERWPAVEQFLDREARRLVYGTKENPRGHGMPWLTFFAENYLLQVVDGRLSLEEAKKRMDDLPRWLLEDLPQTPELWSFVVSLVLCQAIPEERGVPWFQFWALWREVDRVLQRELVREEEVRELEKLGFDDSFVKRGRATVTKPPQGSQVQFADTAAAERLWQALLGSGRGTLSLLMPQLEKLIGEEDRYLRQAAARALGRIGEIDAQYTIESLLRSSFDGGEVNFPRLLACGSFFQGVWGSGNTSYLHRCLTLLRHPPGSKIVWPHWQHCILRSVVYRDLGTYDLPLAVDELHRLLEEEVVHKLEARHTDDRAWGRGTRARSPAMDGLAEGQQAERRVRKLLVHIDCAPVKEEVEAALQPIRFAVTGLLARRRRLSALKAFLPWLRHPLGVQGPLVAMLFLEEGGIAETVNERRVPLGTPGREDDGSAPEVGLLLATIADDSHAVGPLSQFLGGVYGALPLLPPAERRKLRRRFRDLLTDWTRQACNVEQLWEPVSQLLQALAAAPVPGLREAMVNLVRVRAHAEPRLQELAGHMESAPRSGWPR